MAEKAYRLLDDAVSSSKENRPFFLTIAPSAPHANIRVTGTLGQNPVLEFDAPIPAERHEHLFQNEIVPRTDNFNPDMVDG